MRLIHLLVIGALVFAAAYVYRIKMDSTVRTERVLKLHAEIREERDKIAVLRAEWAKLDSPLRLQGLVERHLALKPLNANQYDSLKNLPERPPSLAKPGNPDPIGSMIDTLKPGQMRPPSPVRCRSRGASNDRRGEADPGGSA